MSDSEDACKDTMFGCHSLKSLCNHAAVHQSCKKTCNKCQGNTS